MLRSPELIRAELERRRIECLNSNPTQQRKEHLEQEITRAEQQMDKLLDAYQEDLVSLAELRERAPALRKKIAALGNERASLNLRAIEDRRWSEINQSLDSFVARLNQTAQTLTKAERQKIVRLLVKQIDVGENTITIHHSIPIQQDPAASETGSSQLYKRRLSKAIQGKKFLTSLGPAKFRTPRNCSQSPHCRPPCCAGPTRVEKHCHPTIIWRELL